MELRTYYNIINTTYSVVNDKANRPVAFSGFFNGAGYKKLIGK